MCCLWRNKDNNNNNNNSILSAVRVVGITTQPTHGPLCGLH